MPRYYFDFPDDKAGPDIIGIECSNFAEIRVEALAALPEIARDTFPLGGDDQVLSVRVRDETGIRVYEATLTFKGRRISEASQS